MWLKQNFYIEIAAGERARLLTGRVLLFLLLFWFPSFVCPKHTLAHTHTHLHLCGKTNTLTKSQLKQVEVAFLAAFLCGILFVAAGYKFVMLLLLLLLLLLGVLWQDRMATATGWRWPPTPAATASPCAPKAI